MKQKAANVKKNRTKQITLLLRIKARKKFTRKPPKRFQALLKNKILTL